MVTHFVKMVNVKVWDKLCWISIYFFSIEYIYCYCLLQVQILSYSECCTIYKFWWLTWICLFGLTSSIHNLLCGLDGNFLVIAARKSYMQDAFICLEFYDGGIQWIFTTYLDII